MASKYEPLWKWLSKRNKDEIKLSYAEIEKVLGFKIDHSFLTYKKELLAYGYSVKKISMKEETVLFVKE